MQSAWSEPPERPKLPAGAVLMANTRSFRQCFGRRLAAHFDRHLIKWNCTARTAVLLVLLPQHASLETSKRRGLLGQTFTAMCIVTQRTTLA